VLEELLLQRVQLAVVLEPFDRRDRLALDLSGGGGARADGRPADEHRAGAAVPFTAAELGAGQSEIVAKNPEKRAGMVGVEPRGLAVEREGNFY